MTPIRPRATATEAMKGDLDMVWTNRRREWDSRLTFACLICKQTTATPHCHTYSAEQARALALLGRG